MTAVPESVEAIGLLATFGDKTGMDHQRLFLFRGNYSGDCRLIERDKVKLSGVPT